MATSTQIRSLIHWTWSMCQYPTSLRHGRVRSVFSV